MNKQLFPAGFNPLVCPNCKSETFERSIDSNLDDSYDSNLYCV